MDPSRHPLIEPLLKLTCRLTQRRELVETLEALVADPKVANADIFRRLGETLLTRGVRRLQRATGETLTYLRLHAFSLLSLIALVLGAFFIGQFIGQRRLTHSLPALVSQMTPTLQPSITPKQVSLPAPAPCVARQGVEAAWSSRSTRVYSKLTLDSTPITVHLPFVSSGSARRTQ